MSSIKLSGPVRKITLPITDLRSYLDIYNGLFKMTDMELSVLEELIRIHKEGNNPFTQENKQAAADNLNLKAVSTYLTRLTNKKALFKDGTGYNINPMLIPGKHRHILFNLTVADE